MTESAGVTKGPIGSNERQKNAQKREQCYSDGMETAHVLDQLDFLRGTMLHWRQGCTAGLCLCQHAMFWKANGTHAS